MKLTLLSATLVAAFTLTCASAQAQTNSAPAASSSTMSSTTTTTSKDMASEKKIPYRGTITAVDTSANTVTVKGAKGDMTLMFNTDTKYKGGSALSDFKVGDMVTGSYMKDADGKMTAHSVHKKMSK